MVHSLTARRWVAAIATIMLLLCQTAAAALSHARVPSVAEVAALAQDAALPCHHDGAASGDSTPSNGCQERCPARDASPEKTKIDIPAARALLLTVMALVPPGPRATTAAPRNDFTATAAPPPLRLAYCRLLN